jgi:hypothetical protein
VEAVGGGALAGRGEPDSARGWERSGEGGREHLLHGPKVEERGEGASELKKWRTARLGASSPWRVERPSSACAQGGGAAWRGRETSGETEDRGGPGARHVADGAGVRRRTPSSRRETERERWSEGNLVIKLKFRNSSL